MGKAANLRAPILVGLAGLLSAIPPAAPAQQEAAADYADARASFHTRLLRHLQASSGEVYVHKGADLVHYDSDGQSLFAVMDTPTPGDKHRHPAVLFSHGGFAQTGDWRMCQPYRDAGFVVMTPSYRGENGQPGDFSLFYNEVDDLLAALKYLRAQPNVDPHRVFVAGWSAGGTLAMLAAEASHDIVAAASFSGTSDQRSFIQAHPELVAFDANDSREVAARSALAFAGSFKCPILLTYGSEEQWEVQMTDETAAVGRHFGRRVEVAVFPGDHKSALGAEIANSIEFFKSFLTAPTSSHTAGGR